MRGRVMRVPDIQDLRPTPSRVREAVFNILGSVQGYTMLDLFAGSGVMGLEALSRGADRVVSIEASRKACVAMRAVADNWGVEGWRIVQAKLPKGLPQAQHFDLIYADPPYQSGLAAKVPVWLAAHQATYQYLVIEEASRASTTWAQGMVPTQSRTYGDTSIHFFAGNSEEKA